MISERRRSVRKDFLAKISLTWELEEQKYEQAGMVFDRSEGGLGVHLSRAIPVGTIISVTLASATNFAVVRHCTPTKAGGQPGKRFSIGLELLPATLTQDLSLTDRKPEGDGMEGTLPDDGKSEKNRADV